MRLDARQPHRRHYIRVGPRIVGVVLKVQQRERGAPPALVGAPVVKHEELEIAYAARFFHPKGRCNLYGVAKLHHPRLFVFATHARGPLPFRVAESRHTQHGVWIGRHQPR